MIAEIGFEKIRMRMVAERAGVSTAALHYHFDTRENLFAEALRYSFEHTGRDVYQSHSEQRHRDQRGSPGSSPRRCRQRRACAGSGRCSRSCGAGPNREPESRAVAIELNRAQQGWIEETLDDGIASGEFTPCDTAAHAPA